MDSTQKCSVTLPRLSKVLKTRTFKIILALLSVLILGSFALLYFYLQYHEDCECVSVETPCDMDPANITESSTAPWTKMCEHGYHLCCFDSWQSETQTNDSVMRNAAQNLSAHDRGKEVKKGINGMTSTTTSEPDNLEGTRPSTQVKMEEVATSSSPSAKIQHEHSQPVESPSDAAVREKAGRSGDALGISTLHKLLEIQTERNYPRLRLTETPRSEITAKISNLKHPSTDNPYKYFSGVPSDANRSITTIRLPPDERKNDVLIEQKVILGPKQLEDNQFNDRADIYVTSERYGIFNSGVEHVKPETRQMNVGDFDQELETNMSGPSDEMDEYMYTDFEMNEETPFPVILSMDKSRPFYHARNETRRTSHFFVTSSSSPRTSVQEEEASVPGSASMPTESSRGSTSTNYESTSESRGLFDWIFG